MSKANGQGYTLIEFLIVLGGLGLLLTMAALNYNFIRNNVALKNDSQEIVSVLRMAQNKAMIAEEGVVHGVHFTSNSYILYAGDWAAPLHQTEYSLKKGLMILQGSDSNVVFERLRGRASSTEIMVGSSPSNSRIIRVDDSGNIEID